MSLRLRHAAKSSRTAAIGVEESVKEWDYCNMSHEANCQSQKAGVPLKRGLRTNFYCTLCEAYLGSKGQLQVQQLHINKAIKVGR